MAVNRKQKKVFMLEFKITFDRVNIYARDCDKRATARYADQCELLRRFHNERDGTWSQLISSREQNWSTLHCGVKQ